MRRFLPLLFLAAPVACSGDPAPPPTLAADVFGWTSATGFVTGLPPLDVAATVRVKVTNPLQGEVLDQASFPIGDRNGEIPEIEFGEDLRVDFEVLDTTGAVVASGATPMFDFLEEDEARSYRVQVTPVESFAPYASVVVDRETQQRKFSWSRFDYRATNASWLGRVGHASATTSDGRVLIVGGGHPVPGTASPAALPDFTNVYDDVQIFDPATGYFTDLAFDEAAGAPLEEGRDRLFEPVVHHTLTPLGDDRFLVVGGFTPRSDLLRPVNTIQIIDLNAPVGARVTRLVDAEGSSLVLQRARGWHTATYRAADQQVVIAGGVGPQGDDDVLGTFEMIDLATNTVASEPLELQAARAQHSAVMMADGTTVWLIGGRNADGALASTEIVTLSAGGATESSEEADLRTARYGMGAVRMTPGGGMLVLVAGGFVDLDGTPTANFEVSKLGRGSFESGTSWALTEARGGVAIVELPQTQNIVVFGGRGENGDTVATAERLIFQDLTASRPYEVEASDETTTLRYGATADIISTGQVLLVGGVGEIDGQVAALDSADVYNPHDPVGGNLVIITE